MNEGIGGLKFSPDTLQRSEFSEEYKDQVFWIWYRNEKPIPKRLYHLILPDKEGRVPALSTIEQWVAKFREKVIPIDTELQEKRKEIAIQEKMEMLERHANHGREMQEIALDHIRMNKEKLNTPTAVRMWVEGVRIERESRGLPTLIEKVSSADDEQLMADIEKLLNSMDLETGAVDVKDEPMPDMQPRLP